MSSANYEAISTSSESSTRRGRKCSIAQCEGAGKVIGMLEVLAHLYPQNSTFGLHCS